MSQVDSVSNSNEELIVVTSDNDVYRLPQGKTDDSEMFVYLVDDVPEFVVTHLEQETGYRLGEKNDGNIVEYVDYPIKSGVELRTDNAIESHLYHNMQLPTEEIDHADLSALNLDFEIYQDGTTVVTNVSIWPTRSDIYFTDDAFDDLNCGVDKDAIAPN